MTQPKPGFLQRLQTKWQLKSLTQVLLVLLVFACTGTTILLIKNPILAFFGIERGGGFMNTLAYLLLVLPLYQIMLLIYGFIFGQFRFFLEKEKQLVQRIGRVFNRKKKKVLRLADPDPVDGRIFLLANLPKDWEMLGILQVRIGCQHLLGCISRQSQ